MANKIKVFVGFLALIALFSVYSFLNSFSVKTATTITNNTKGMLSLSIEKDTDKDGLSNKDESYWNTDFQNPDTDGDGFLDGEEVSSSHDPLIPAPNDLIDNKNMTAKFSNLTLSGLYEGSLGPSNPGYAKSLDDMALAVMDGAATDLSSKIDLSKFKIVSSSKKNQEIYLEEVSVIYKEFISNFGEDVKNLQKYLDIIGNEGFKNKELINFFQIRATGFQKTYEKGSSLNIPQNWVQNHANFLHIVKNLQLANQSIAHGSDDPVKASSALSIIGDSFQSLSSLIDAFTAKIKSEKLSNQYFKSLSQ